MNHVGDFPNKYKCYVVIDFSIIVALVIFYFIYAFNVYIYIYVMLYTVGYKLL